MSKAPRAVLDVAFDVFVVLLSGFFLAVAFFAPAFEHGNFARVLTFIVGFAWVVLWSWYRK